MVPVMGLEPIRLSSVDFESTAFTDFTTLAYGGFFIYGEKPKPFVAASVGFEPTVDSRPSLVFKTSSLNRSDNLPY